MLLRPPSVYPPQEDAWLRAGALATENLGPDSRVLDICTGTGALSLCAAAAGAGHVTPVDVPRRALVTTWINLCGEHRSAINARLPRHPVRVVRGDLTAPVQGRHFDVVVSNPPYVPASADILPTHGIERACDTGVDGRLLLDRSACRHPQFLRNPTLC